MTPAALWIQSRLADAPPRLLDVLISALEPYPSVPVPEALAQAALRRYREVLQSPGSRSDALSLLAADALFTHAMEAQAELNPTELASFADRWSGRGKLGDLA